MSTQRARSLRKSMTPPERRLWSELKTRPNGFKFRRQHPFGPYVLDFFCHEAAMGIEVDGLAHDLGSNPHRDLRRDAWLADQGVQTLRIAATDVRDDLEAIIILVTQECLRRSPREERPSTASGGPPPLQMQGRTGEP